MTPQLQQYMPRPARDRATRIRYHPLLSGADLSGVLLRLPGPQCIVPGGDYPFLAGGPGAVLHAPCFPPASPRRFGARARAGCPPHPAGHSR